MSDMKTEILAVLANSVRRDMERGGTGTLSTSEVAGRAAVSSATARRLLSELEDEGAVECWDDSSEESSRPIYSWRLAGYEWTEDAGLFKVDSAAAPAV